MRRKTFIKQAMAAGMQRNLAALFAKEAALRGEPYYFALGRLLNFQAMINDLKRKSILDLLRYGQAELNVGEALALWYPWVYKKLASIPVGKLQIETQTAHIMGTNPMTAITDKICPGGGTK